jgi:acyl-CoA synthetase (AMP-forming)/AMP-acid ligase II
MSKEDSDFKDGWWYSDDLVKVDENGFYYVVDRKIVKKD